MDLLILDLSNTYISFEKQATKADGAKINPTVATVRIFEEGGADATYDNSEIAGSPFTCNIINGKVGNYGALVAKSLFTAGKIYRVLYEWTVDAITTAEEENFHAVNLSQFKATVTNLDVAVSSRSTPANITTAHATTDGKIDVVDNNVDLILTGTISIESKVDIMDANIDLILADTNEIQGKLPTNEIMGSSVKTDKDDEIDDIQAKINSVTFGLSALKDLLDAIDTSTELAARFTEIKGAGWTTETLKTLQVAIDASVTLNDITTRGR